MRISRRGLLAVGPFVAACLDLAQRRAFPWLAKMANGAQAAQFSAARREALGAKIIALERSLWEGRSPGGSASAHLLADDLEIIKHGHRFSKSEDSKEARDVQVTSYTIEDVQARVLTPDVVLLSYRAKVTWKGSYRGKQLASLPPRPLWVGSIWVRRDGKWFNTFFEENYPDEFY